MLMNNEAGTPLSDTSPIMKHRCLSSSMKKPYNLFLLQFSEVAVGSLVEFKEVQLIAAFVTEEDHLPAIRFVTVGQSVRSAPVYIPLRSQFVVSQQLVVQ